MVQDRVLLARRSRRPPGPTMRVSASCEEASEKCTAEPPSSRSRLPDGVSTASKAMDPTTVSVMAAREASGRLRCAACERSGSASGAGPRSSSWSRTRPCPSPATSSVLIRVTRAGINFADTHARENTYLARYELPLVARRGGGRRRRARRRTASTPASASSRWSGTGGYAEYAAAPRGDDVRASPTASSDARRARAAAAGPDRVAPVPHVRAARAGRERRRARRGRRASARSPSSSASRSAPAA